MKLISVLHCCMWVAMAGLPSITQAADGDVIISRTVQPRVATRAPVQPDPNPQVVNPGKTVLGVTSELGDGDFAGISSGLALPQRLLTNQPGPNVQLPMTSMPGMSAAHSGSAGGSGIAGQVNRSVQQGLRPLQMLGGR